MAQHYNLEHYKNETWYKKLIKRIKWCVKATAYQRSKYPEIKYYKRLNILSTEYKLNLPNENLILSYRTTLKDFVEDNNWLQLRDCEIEIHCYAKFKTSKILKAYLVA